MKKATKNLLIGTGIAAAGVIVYSAWKDAEKPAVAQHAAPTTLPKEYVERRRRQHKVAAEARRAVQQETVAPLPKEEMPQDDESLHGIGEKPAEGSAALAEQNATPVKPAPLEQVEEQKEYQ